jgi:hypothetical protein
MRALLTSLCLVIAAPLAAQPAAEPAPLPEAFAWQWSLPIASGDSAARFMLTPEVYARLTRDDLADLAAFNAAGQSMPLGPAQHAYPRMQADAPPAPVALPLFRIPRPGATGAAGDDLRLLIERGPDGKLRRLEAAVDAGATTGPVSDWLLDLGALPAPVNGLRLALDAAAGGQLDARVELQGSRDLASWQRIDDVFAVVSLQQGGFRLERLRLGFAPVEWPYLRLRRVDRDDTLPLAAVTADLAQRVAVPDQRLALRLQGAPAAEGAGTFEYRLAGPFPIERVTVELAERNSVAEVIVESRAEGATAWRERARGTVFRIGGDADEASAGGFEIAVVRDRHWRVRSTPALGRAPTLQLGYRSEPFIVLAQGEGPYRLAAGSRSARRPDYPLRAVFAGLAAQQGSDWLPPEIALDAGQPLAGDAALTAPVAPRPWGQYLLWTVLVVGALLIAAMAAKLMREPPPAG